MCISDEDLKIVHLCGFAAKTGRAKDMSHIKQCVVRMNNSRFYLTLPPPHSSAFSCLRVQTCGITVHISFCIVYKTAASYRLESWGLIPGREKVFLFTTKFRPAVGSSHFPKGYWGFYPWGYTDWTKKPTIHFYLVHQCVELYPFLTSHYHSGNPTSTLSWLTSLKNCWGSGAASLRLQNQDYKAGASIQLYVLFCITSLDEYQLMVKIWTKDQLKFIII